MNARCLIKSILPQPLRRAVSFGLQLPLMRRILHFGLSHYCVVCRSPVRRFIDYGRMPIHKNEECPVCGAHRRHRLIWLYFNRRPELFPRTGMRLLDVAPAECLTHRLRSKPQVDYLSADLESPLAMETMDISDIQYDSDSFDAIYCSHVLQYIKDDVSAMKELFRILRPGGWAILQVRLDPSLPRTVRDERIRSVEDRENALHIWDEYREWIYGADYKTRLESAGFTVTVDTFVKRFSNDYVRRLGLDPTENIYFCTKKQQVGSANEIARSTADGSVVALSSAPDRA